MTRRNLHVDRTVCPWLIRRFVDPKARFVFVGASDREPQDGRRFDMLDAEFTHEGPRCTDRIIGELVVLPR